MFDEAASRVNQPMIIIGTVKGWKEDAYSKPNPGIYEYFLLNILNDAKSMIKHTID